MSYHHNTAYDHPHTVVPLHNGTTVGSDDCCICCGTFATSSFSRIHASGPLHGKHYLEGGMGYQPIYVNGEAINPYDAGAPPGGWAKGAEYATCYCNCCACYPTNNLEFSILEGNVFKWHTHDHEGNKLACGQPLHTYDEGQLVGTSWGYTEPMSNKNSWEFAMGRTENVCRDRHSQLQTMTTSEAFRLCGSTVGDAGAELDIPNYAGASYTDTSTYPESWGYEGLICHQGEMTTPDCPGYSYPGPSKGMAIKASLCCCKNVTTNYWGKIADDGFTPEEVDFGDSPCPPIPNTYSITHNVHGTTKYPIYKTCPIDNVVAQTWYLLDNLGESTTDLPDHWGATAVRGRECMLPCFNFTLQANDTYWEKEIQTVGSALGQITSIEVTDGGNYGIPSAGCHVEGTTITIDAPPDIFNARQATATVETDGNIIGTHCKVLSVTMNDHGAGYSQADPPNVTFTEAPHHGRTAEGVAHVGGLGDRTLVTVKKTSACSDFVYRVGECTNSNTFKPGTFYGGKFHGANDRTHGIPQIMGENITAGGTMALLSGQCKSEVDDKKFAIAFLGAFETDCDCQTGTACLKGSNYDYVDKSCAGVEGDPYYPGCGCDEIVGAPGDPEDPCTQWVDPNWSLNYNSPGEGDNDEDSCCFATNEELDPACLPCYTVMSLPTTPGSNEYNGPDGDYQSDAAGYNVWAALDWDFVPYWEEAWGDQCNEYPCQLENPDSPSNKCFCDGCKAANVHAARCGKVTCRYCETDGKCHSPCASRTASTVWFTGIIEEE